jgi:hypothetical protein
MSGAAVEIVQVFALLVIFGAVMCIAGIVSEYVFRWKERRRIRRVMGGK